MIFLLGGFQSGKTQAVIERASLCRRNSESFQIITPSRLLCNAALTRLLPPGSAVAGRPVITLSDLQHGLMEHCFPNPSSRPRALSNFEQFLLISSVITSMEKDFRAFRDISRRPRLIKSLYGLVRSLRDEDVLTIPGDESLRERTEDLQKIIGGYQALMDQGGLCDEAHAVRLLSDALPSCPYAFPKHIFVDGFTDLTASQFRLLSAYMKAAERSGSSVTLTLSLSRSAVAADTLELFTKTFPDAVREPLGGAPSLGEAFLEGAPPASPPEIFEIQAFGLHKECEETANRVKKLLLFEGALPSEIFLISPKHEIYTPILNSVFRKAGIPLHFTKDELLKQNPLVIFFKQCLLMMGNPLTHESLSALAKSNYVKPSLRRAFASAPLLIPQALDGPPAFWKKRLETCTENPAQTKALTEALSLLEGSLFSVKPFEKYPVQRFFGALISFMAACGLSEMSKTGAQNGRDESALRKLRDVFSQLKKSLMLMGDDTLPLRTFLFYFDSIIEETRYRVQLPKSGAVTVLSLDEARGLGARAVFFLGMNEGSFPPAPSWDLFDNVNRVRLNRAAKEILGRTIWETDARHFQRSKFLFASALSMAKGAVFFCRTPADERGNYLPQSHFLTRILGLAPFKRIPYNGDLDVSHEKIDPRAQNREIFALKPPAEEIYASCFLPFSTKNANLEDILAHKKAIEEAQNALDKGILPENLETLKHFGDLGPSSQAALKYRGQEIHLSPTTLDKFGRCLYQSLWNSVWKIQGLSLPEYSPKATDTGLLYHKVLEIYLAKNGDGPFDGPLLGSLIGEAAETFPQKDVFLLDYHHIYAVLQKFLKNTHAELVKTQAPEKTEYPTDSLTAGITVGGVLLKVHGVIDRIDQDRIEGRHIIDYKTSGKAYPEYFKTLFCLFQGCLYAMVVEAAGLGPVKSISYQFLENGKGLYEFPTKQKGISFNSLAEYSAHKKEELAALLGILREGRFLPYTLAALVPQNLIESTSALYGKIKFEYEKKCTYCDYKNLCLRTNKLSSTHEG